MTGSIDVDGMVFISFPLLSQNNRQRPNSQIAGAMSAKEQRRVRHKTYDGELKLMLKH